MANSAPYEVNVSGTDDETFTWSLPFENEDGTAFPFSDYSIEYVVVSSGSELLRLTQEQGITIQAPTVTFKASNSALKPGEYQHGCRVRHLATGDFFQIFDGTVRIDEGHF